MLWFKQNEELTDERVRIEGMKLLFDALMRCNCLRKLQLDGFFGTSSEESDILKLEMQSSLVPNGGASFIASLIGRYHFFVIILKSKHSSYLFFFVFYDSTLTLFRNTSISSLVVSENSFGDDGALIISEALKKNKSLNLLDVQNCQIFENGIRLIAHIRSSSHCFFSSYLV